MSTEDRDRLADFIHNFRSTSPWFLASEELADLLIENGFVKESGRA